MVTVSEGPYLMTISWVSMATRETKTRKVLVVNTKEKIIKIIGYTHTVRLPFSINLRVIIGMESKIVIRPKKFFISSFSINCKAKVTIPRDNKVPPMYKADRLS